MFVSKAPSGCASSLRLGWNAGNGALVDPMLQEILQNVAVGVLKPEDAAVQLGQIAGGSKQVGAVCIFF